MRGHALPHWELDPCHLLIWLLRVALLGRSECPALAGPLREALGEGAIEAVAAVQLLALGLQRGGAMLPDGPAFTEPLAAHEEAVLAALVAAECGQPRACHSLIAPWTGAHALAARAALQCLARVFNGAGLRFGPAPGIAAE